METEGQASHPAYAGGVAIRAELRECASDLERGNPEAALQACWALARARSLAECEAAAEELTPGALAGAVSMVRSGRLEARPSLELLAMLAPARSQAVRLVEAGALDAALGLARGTGVREFLRLTAFLVATLLQALGPGSIAAAARRGSILAACEVWEASAGTTGSREAAAARAALVWS